MLLSGLFMCFGAIAVLAMLATLLRYGPLVVELHRALVLPPSPAKDLGLRVQFLAARVPAPAQLQPYRPKFITSRPGPDAPRPSVA